MEIPMMFKKNNQKYLIEKEYPNFVLYTNLSTGVKECFTRHELGLIQEKVKPPKNDLNVEKVKL